MIDRRFPHTDPAVARDGLVAPMLRDIPPRPPNAAETRADNMGMEEPAVPGGAAA